MKRRAVLFVATLAALYLFNFFIPRLMPGDPLQYSSAVGGEDMDAAYTAEQLEQLREWYGLDKPLAQQFADTVSRNLRGDWGYSIHYHMPVTEVLAQRLPWTAGLMAVSLAASLAAGVALALWCVRSERADRVLSALASLLCETPPYLIGLLLLFCVAAPSGWLPLGGGETAFAVYTGPVQRLADLALHALLPAVSLWLVMTPGFFFTARASCLAVAARPYLTGARAKGLAEGRIRRVYLLRNAAPPIIARAFLSLGQALGGALLVENVFGYPGVGTVMREAVRYRDYPMLQGVFGLSALLMVCSLAAGDWINRKRGAA